VVSYRRGALTRARACAADLHPWTFKRRIFLEMPPATQTSVVAALCLGRSAQETIARAMFAPGRLGLSGMYRLLLDTVRARHRSHSAAVPGSTGKQYTSRHCEFASSNCGPPNGLAAPLHAAHTSCALVKLQCGPLRSRRSRLPGAGLCACVRRTPGADAPAPGPQAGVPISRALRLFADAAKFPVLVHCVIGKDRTGLVMMLLLLLCGVAEADVINDYVVSEALLHAARAKGELRTLHGARPGPVWAGQG